MGATWKSLFFSGKEEPREKERKALLLPLASVGAGIFFVFVTLSIIFGSLYDAGWNFTKLCTVVGLLAYVAATKRLPQRLSDVVLTVIFLHSSVILDIETYGEAEYWTLGVLLMDCLLVTGTSNRWTLGCFAVLVVYIVTITTAQASETWIFDVWFHTDTYDRPEPTGWVKGTNLLQVRMLVFCADFYMTRSFAYGLRSREADLERAVVIVERVATALGNFDTSQAQETLAEGGLPKELQSGFERLVDNLTTYRPYLPQSVIVPVSESGDGGDQMATTCFETTTTLNSSHSTSSITMSFTGHKRRVTLVRFAVPLGGFTPQYEEHLSGVVQCIGERRGIIDRIDGDSIHASFNGSRVCTTHQSHAVMAALCITKQHHGSFAGVAAGEASCGTLGCDGVRAYQILGRVAFKVDLLAKASQAFAIPIATCHEVYAESSFAAFYRLVDKVQYGDHAVGYMWEALGAKQAEAADEWMYQLERMHAVDRWNIYNKASMAYWSGDRIKAQRILSEAELSSYPASESDSYAALAERIASTRPAILKLSPFSSSRVSSCEGDNDTLPDLLSVGTV